MRPVRLAAEETSLASSRMALQAEGTEYGVVLAEYGPFIEVTAYSLSAGSFSPPSLAGAPSPVQAVFLSLFRAAGAWAQSRNKPISFPDFGMGQPAAAWRAGCAWLRKAGLYLTPSPYSVPSRMFRRKPIPR